MKRPKYVYNLYSIIGSTRELKPEWQSFDTPEEGKRFIEELVGSEHYPPFWESDFVLLKVEKEKALEQFYMANKEGE